MSAACSNTLGSRAIAANAIVAMVWLAAFASGPANAMAASPSRAGSLSQIIVTPFVEPTTSINAVSTQFESQFASRLEAAAPGRVAARLSTASPRQVPLEARDVRDLGATESASYVVVGAWLPESGANADPTREALIELRSAHSGATHSRYRFVASGDPAGGDARDAEVDRIAIAMVHDLGAEPETETLASVATPGPASSSEPSTRKRNDFLSVDGDEPIEINSQELELIAEGPVKHLIFTSSVEVVQGDMKLFAGRLEAIYPDGASQPDRLDARQNVRVLDGNVEVRCIEATYLRKEEIVICKGDALLLQGCDEVRGSEIEFRIREERVKVTGAASVVLRLDLDDATSCDPVRGAG